MNRLGFLFLAGALAFGLTASADAGHCRGKLKGKLKAVATKVKHVGHHVLHRATHPTKGALACKVSKLFGKVAVRGARKV